MSLRIAKDLSLPLEVVTERSAFIGRTGQGKSYAAQKLAELLYAAKAQFLVLDPVGIWWGLRLAANGKDPGLNVPVIGGLHGDLPLDPGAGAQLADLAVDRGLSLILDVSQIEHDTDRNRFARAFGDRFFFRKKARPSAVLVFFEEGQEFFPQNPGPKETDMLRTFTRLAKIGRNFGIGIAVITQRPQEVNKKVLNLTELLFAFQLNGKHERKAVESWIEDKAIDEDISAELPKLARGHPHAWSPSWLKISRVVAIAPRWTFDASSTPTVGRDAGAVKELAPIDLEQLRKELAATIERAKADDPKELRRRIADLERSLKAAHTAPVPAATREKTVEKCIEVPVLRDGQLKRLEGLAERAGRLLDQVDGAATALRFAVSQALVLRTPPAVPIPTRSAAPPAPVRGGVTPPPIVAAEGDGPLMAAAQRKILNALAFLEAVGLRSPDKTQVSLFAGLSPTAGHTTSMFGGLRTAGLIAYPEPGHVQLTPAARDVVEPQRAPQTPEEMHQLLLAKLPSAQQKILTVLIAAYPLALYKDDCSVRAGLSPTAGHTTSMYGGLRSLGVIRYPRAGQVVADKVLFLEGA